MTTSSFRSPSLKRAHLSPGSEVTADLFCGSASFWAATAVATRALGNSHHLVRAGTGILLAIPWRLIEILQGRAETAEPTDGEEAVIVCATRPALSRMARSALEHVGKMVDVGEGLRTLHLDPPFNTDEASHFRLLPLMNTAAARLGILIMRAAAQAAGKPFVLHSPDPSASVADGGGDALVQIGELFFWLQWSGGSTISILPHKKWPRQFALNFFRTGAGPLDEKALERRKRIFGELAGVRADVIQIAINKAAPVRGPLHPRRGFAMETGAPPGARPRRVWTYSALVLVPRHPLAPQRQADAERILGEIGIPFWPRVASAQRKQGPLLSRWTR